DVQRDVVAAEVAVAGRRALVLMRLVLEHLEVEAEAAAVEADLVDNPSRVDVEVIEHPVVVVPHLGQRVDVVEAEHVHEESVRLLHVRDGDADVVAAAQSGYAFAHAILPIRHVSNTSNYGAYSSSLPLIWIHLRDSLLSCHVPSAFSRHRNGSS